MRLDCVLRWLELKEMLVRKNRKVAMKSKRRWRKFWGKRDEEGVRCIEDRSIYLCSCIEGG